MRPPVARRTQLVCDRTGGGPNSPGVNLPLIIIAVLIIVKRDTMPSVRTHFSRRRNGRERASRVLRQRVDRFGEQDGDEVGHESTRLRGID